MKLRHNQLAAAALLGMGLAFNVSDATVRGTVGNPPPVAQSDRTPIFMLSAVASDVGRGMLGEDQKTPYYTLSNAPETISQAVVYADIDTVDMADARVQATFDRAKALHWPIVLESGTWSVANLHAFVAAHFPGAVAGPDLYNVSVKIEWRGKVPVVTDTDPTEAAVMIGIPRAETTEGLLEAAFAESPADGNSSFKIEIGDENSPSWLDGNGSPGDAHWTVGFAQKAYASNVVAANIGGRSLVLYRDVVKIWQLTTVGIGRKDCIVAFRGTTNAGDWLRNLENQIAFKRIPGEPNSNGARAGAGYVDRFNNYKNLLDQTVKGNCNKVYVTGHSLGGGQAQLYAWWLAPRRTNPQLGGLAVYNPARIANPAMANQWQGRKRPSVDGRFFCRYRDFVNGLPLNSRNIGDGCARYYPYHSKFNYVDNHNLKYWRAPF